MIKFKNLSVKNFLSFGNVETSIDLNSYKSNLITGQNGAGKSSLIIEGLTFALFGQAYRDIKKSQLINFVNNKDCLVKLEFEINKDSYKIIRGQKPNILELYKNNEIVPETSSSKEFQNYIETEILRMNLVSFKQLVVLGTANFIPFMQLSTPHRRKLVDDLLDVAIFTKMDQLNKGNIKELTQKMNENSIKISSMKSELQAYELLLKEQNDSVFSQNELLEQEIIEKQNLIKNLKIKIDELNSSIKSLQELIATDTSVNNFKKLENAKLLLEIKTTDLQNKINETRNKDVCSSCQQKISDERKNEIIFNLTKSIEESNSKSNLINVKLNSLLPEVEVYNKRLKELTNKNTELTSKNTEFNYLVQELKKLTEQKNNTKEVDLSIVKKVNELKETISALEQNQQNWFNEKYLRTVLSTLLVDSGIKSAVIKKFIPIINKRINHYLKILGADYMFFLDNDFNEQIRGSGREKSSYYSFSQGEKSRVDLALMFTWRDVSSIVSGSSINILVLDEVFDSAVDQSGIDGIRNIINNLDSNVFIISHREQNSDDFNRHIDVKKKGRYSYIEEVLND